MRGTDQVFDSEHILIASGSEPRPPSFQGADLCMNSNDFFSMEELPKSMAVIGAGYIGVELAQILQALGVEVTLIVRSRPLRFLDQDILDILI